MAAPRKCELYGCGKPIHDYVIKVWGAVGLCKTHYEQEKGSPNIGCIHIPKDVPEDAEEQED